MFIHARKDFLVLIVIRKYQLYFFFLLITKEAFLIEVSLDETPLFDATEFISSMILLSSLLEYRILVHKVIEIVL